MQHNPKARWTTRTTTSKAPFFLFWSANSDSSELERQKTIAENRLLLDSLGLDPNGASKIPGRAPKLAKPSSSKSASGEKKDKKRKAPVVDEGPRRRSGRLAGIEATPEEIAKKEEEDEKEREELRIISRKERRQVMQVSELVEESSPSTAEELVSMSFWLWKAAGLITEHLPL